MLGVQIPASPFPLKMPRFIPAARFHFLDTSYDLLCALLGLGKHYRKKALEFLRLENKKLKVLDAGCGTGSIATELKKKYPDIDLYGIDIDEDMLLIAKAKIKKMASKIKLKKASIDKLPFPNNYFDAVYSSLVFHHLPGEIKPKAISEIYRVLKKNGKFFISDFGKPRNIFESILPLFSVIFEEGYDNYKGNIPKMLEKAKFKEVKETGKYGAGGYCSIIGRLLNLCNISRLAIYWFVDKINR